MKALRLIFTALLLTLSSGLPSVGQAQVLVSNIGQSGGSSILGRCKSLIPGLDHAQSFTTGGHSAGYRLSSVDVAFGGFPAGHDYSAGIYTRGSEGKPDRHVGNLRVPPVVTAFTAPRNLRFSAPGSGITLEAGAEYFVVLDFEPTNETKGSWHCTPSDNEDTGGADGWKIGNQHLFRLSSTGNDWLNNLIPSSLQMRLNGEVVPLPEVTITGGLAVTEGGMAVFTVHRTGETRQALTVLLDVSENGAAGGDFVAPDQEGRKRVTIPAGRLSAPYRVPTARDVVDEGAGSVVVGLADSTAYQRGKPASARVDIRDDDDPPEGTPVVEISAAPDLLREGNQGNFLLRAVPAPGAPLTVTVTVVDSGDFAASGQAGERSVVIGTGGTGVLRVDTEDDDTAETDGVVTAIVKVGTGYSAHNARGAARFTVKDDDGSDVPRVSISGGAAVTEGEKAVFTIRTTAPVKKDLTVMFGISETAGSDFVSLETESMRTATIKAGMQTHTLDVPTVNDETDEPDGSVTVRLGQSFLTGGNFYSIDRTAEMARITVRDNDLPAVTVTPGPSPVVEGSTATFTVRRIGETTTALTVLLAVSESAGADYVADAQEGDKEIIIPPGSGSATYTVPTEVDTTDEPDGSVTVALRADAAYTSGSPSMATVQVTDDDPAVNLSVSGGGAVSEGGTVTLTATRSVANTSGEALSIPIRVKAQGTTAQAINPIVADYTFSATAISIPDGASSGTATFMAVDDFLQEPAETVVVELGTLPAGTVAGADSAVTITIAANDSPELSVALIETTPAEEGTDIVFLIRSTSAPAKNFQVNLEVSQTGTFVDPDDLGDQTVSFADTNGIPGTIRRYTVKTVGDDIDELDGRVTVRLKPSTEDPATYALNSRRPRVISRTVRDNDPTIVSLSRTGTGAIDEGGTTEFTVTLGRALVAGEIIDVPLVLSGTGVTMADLDALGLKAGSALNKGVSLVDAGTLAPVVRFTGHATDVVQVATLELVVTEDSTPEGRETLTVALGPDDDSANGFDLASRSTNVGGGADPKADAKSFDVTVNADEQPTVSLSASSATASEASGSRAVTLTATRSEANSSGEALSIPIWVKAQGTTAVAADYTLSATAISIADGATTGTATFTVTDDSADEPAETVVVGLLESADTVTITIADDDATEVSLSRTGSGAVSEGRTVAFTVTLGRALVAGEIIDVPLVLSGTGVTMADLDALMLAAGSALNKGVSLVDAGTLAPVVRFTGHATDVVQVATLELVVTDDSTPEGRETFTVALGPNDATANGFDLASRSTNVGGGADPDDDAKSFDVTVSGDPRPVITIADGGAVTEGAIATFTVTLSTPYNKDVTFTATTATDTASADDYTHKSEELTIAAGEVQASFTVTTRQDAIDETSETFTVTLSAASVDIDESTASATIMDDDDPPVLSIRNVLLGDEGDTGTKVVTHSVTLSSASGKSVAVNYADTQTGTASSGKTGDYAVVPSGTLRFAAGETRKSIRIKVNGDIVYEPDETIILRLSDPVNATLSGNKSTLDAIGFVTNDDAPPIPTIAPGDTTVVEGETAIFTVSRKHDFEEITVFYGTKPGSADIATNDVATPGSDYTDYNTDSNIIFREGEKEITLEFETVDDNLHEGPEDFTIQISSKYYSEAFTVTISDNDDPPTATLNLASPSISENNERSRITASLDRPTSHDLRLAVKTTPTVPAVSGDIEQTGKWLRIPAGTTASTGIVALTGVDNSVDTPDKTVTVSALLFGNSEVDDPDDKPVAVRDNDPTIVSLSRTGTGAIDEGGTTAFTVTLGRALVAGEIIGVPLSIDGTGVTTGDWSLALKTGNSLNTGVTLTGATTATPQLQFAGAGAETATLVLTATADSATESAETITVALGPDGDGTNGFDRSGRGTNVGGGADPDDDAKSFDVTVSEVAPALVFAPAEDVSVDEGDTASYTVRLAGKPTGDVTVTIASDDTGAVTVADTDAVIDGPQNTLSFTDTTWNTAQSVTVRGVEDDDTTDEDVTLTHTAAGGNYAGVTGTLDVAVSDDEQPAVTLSASSATASEASGSRAVTLTVTRSAANTSGEALSIPIRVKAQGTTAVAADYTLSATAISIADGASSGTATFTVVDDSTDEPAETVVVELGALPAGTVAGSDSEVTITIADDDATPVTLRTPDTAAAEGDPTDTAGITLTLGRALVAGESLAVPVSIAGGIVGTDYTLALTAATGVTLAGETVTFTGGTGATATVATVLLTAAQDDDTTDETLTVSIPAASSGEAPILTATGLSGGATGSREGSGVITVTDDDNTAPTVSTAIPDRDATVGAAFSYAFPANTFTDADSDALTYTATQSDGSVLPTWLSFTAGSRSFAGTPAAGDTGPVTVRVTADDDNGGTVSDDFVITVHPAPALVFAPAEDVAVDEGDTASYTVRLTGKPTADVTVTIASDDTGAVTVADTDAVIDGIQDTLSFTDTTWNTAQSVTVRGVEDDDTTDEDVTLTHTAAGGNYVGVTGTLDVTVSDDEQPAVTLSASSATASEASGSRAVTLTVTRSAANTSGEALSIPIRVKAQGTTAVAADYTLSATAISIADGASSGTATFTVVDDSTDEPAETVVVELGALPAGTVAGSDTEVTITIADDDDVPFAGFTQDDVTVTEDVGSVDLVIELSEASGKPVSLTWSTGGVGTTATAGEDFVEQRRVALTFAPGETRKTISVAITDDNIDETSEWIGVQLFSPRNARADRNIVMVQITDDDATEVVLATPDTTASEGDPTDTAGITVTLGRALVAGESLAVPVSIAGGIVGTDYTLALTAATGVALAGETVTFTGGTGAQSVATLTLAPGEDDDTTDETLTVSIPAASSGEAPILTATGLSGGATGSREGTGVITVTDDDNTAPTVSTAIPDRDATVGAAFSYAFAANTFTDADSDALSYTATQSDGSVLPTWLSFTANTRTFAGTPAAGDTGPVTVRVTADDDNGGTVSDDFVITVHPAPALVFAPAEDVAVDEGDTASYTVRLAGKPTADVTVTIASDDTGAVTVADTDAVIDGIQNTLSFTDTTWNTAQSVTVRGVEDDDTTDEDVTLTHTAAGGNYVGVTGTLDVAVSDDEQPAVTLSASSATASEASGSRAVTLTVTRSAANTSGEALSIPIRVKAQGTTAVAADYTLSATAISIADGASSGTATFTVVDDSTDEPAETVVVELGALPAGTVAGSDSEVTITIADDDATPVTLRTPDTAAAEGDPTDTAGITLTLGRALVAGESLAVPVSIAGGIVGTDYTLALTAATGVTLAGETVTFTGGTGAQSVATLTLAAGEDADAVDDTLTVSIPASSTGDGVTLGATGLDGGATGSRPGDGEITVTDDDTAGVTITETSGGTSVTEASGDGNSDSYTVVLDTQPSHDVTITVTAETGVLVDGPDQATTGSATETLSFTTTTWNRAQSVTVTGVDDDTDQDANREVTISHAASSTDTDYGSTLDIDDVTVTLVNDDVPAVTLSASSATASEASGSRAVTLTVTRSAANTSGEALSIPIRVKAQGTTAVAADYTLSATAISIADGASSGTATFTVVDDSTDEPAETVVVELGALPAGTVAGSDSEVTITIADDDDVPFAGFTQDDVTVTEDVGSVDLVIELSEASGKPVSLTWSTGGVGTTATAGEDFVEQRRVALTFAPGETRKTISVAITDDNIDETSEWIGVQLFSPRNARADRNIVMVQITDDDATEVVLATPDTTASEGDPTDTAGITLTLGRALVAGESLAVPVSIAGGIVGTDYTLALTAATGVALAGETVTFTGGTGATATVATVLLTAVQDDDTTDETLTVSIPAASSGEAPILTATGLSGGATGSREGTGVITITDDDTPNTAPTVSTAIPDRDATVGAAFSYAFPANTFTDADSDALTYTATQSDGSVLPTWLSFTAGSRSFAGTPAAGDTGPVTVRVTADDDNGGTVSDDFVITVSTVSAPALVFRQGTQAVTAVAVGEGGTTTYTVELAQQPTGNVTVTITSDDTGAVTVDDTDTVTDGPQNTLTFTDTTWDDPQTVRVRGVADDDTTNEDVTLTHTAAGGNYAGVTGTLDVAVTDTTLPALSIVAKRTEGLSLNAADELVYPEDAVLATFTATLSMVPTANFDVCVRVTETGADRVALASEGIVTQRFVTMESGQTSQDFTISWTDDATDEVDSVVTVEAVDPSTAGCSATNGSYGLDAVDVAAKARIEDNDATLVSLVRSGAGAIDEGGTAEFTVTLARALVAGERIDVPLSIAGTDVTTDDWSLALKPGDGLNTGVTLTGATTATPQLRFAGAAAETATLVLTATTDSVTESAETITVALGPDQTPVDNAFDALVDDSSDRHTAPTGTNVGGGADPHGTNNAFNIVVNNVAPNRAPTVGTAIPDRDATVGAAFSYAFPATTFVDADSDALSYTATQSDGSVLPTWLSFTAGSRSFAGTPAAGDTGPVTVRVTANDGNGGTVSDDFVITVHPAPALVLAPAEDVSVDEGDTARYTVRLAGKPTGDVTVTIASDDTGAVTVADTDAVADGPQNTLSFTTTDWNSAQSVTVRGVEDDDATDEDVALTHSAAGGNYAGVTGTLAVRVSDDETPNRSPTVDAGLVDQSATVGAAFSYAFAATTFADADNDPLSYSAAGPQNAALPSWLTFTANTRTLTGTPPDAAAGTVVIVWITANDGNGGTVSDDLSITVSAAPNRSPTVSTAIPDQDATVGTAFSYAFAATTFADADSDALAYTATQSDGSALPGWLSFTAGSRLFSGTPAAGDTGPVTVRVTADDGNGGTVSDDFVITVSAAPNRSPTVDTAIPDRDATVGAAFSYAFPATTFVDADSDALSYTATQSDGSVLPTWLSFTAGSRSFAGTPAAGDTGPVTVRVTANDGNGGTVSDDFVITVHPAPALVLAPAEDVSVDEGDTARYTVRLAGKPTGDVTVTIASDDTGAVTVADTDAVADGPQNTLSFTTTDWNSAQSVTVRGVEDDDATDEDVALTHSAAGGNYAGVTGTLAVRVSDDDMRDDLAAAAADAGLVRFGRTVGEQSVSAVRDRLSADRRQGFTGSLAGQALPSMDGTAASVNDGTASSPVNEAVNEAAGPGAEISEDAELAGSGAGSGGPTAVTALRSWLAGPGDAVDAGAGAQVRALDATDIVAGTSFALTRETDGGGTLALWGRGVHSGFSGQQGGIDIDGRVTGFQLGADHARGDWTYGLMVSRSTGDIEYSAAQGGGEIGLDLTALVPYVGWDVTAGLSAWGTLGFGRGDMTLTPETPETPDGGAVLRSDIDWQMAAAGVEGILTPSTRVLGGAALNWHADALWTRTRADALPGRRGAPGGETTRLRFGLESRWQHSLASGGVLTPQLEMALRHDGGDAETGFGLEIGGGLDWSAPERGLSLGLSGRTLALHEDGSFGDWGVSVVLDYDPAPDTKRGFAARLSHDLGGSASGGAQALLGPESFPGLNAASGGGRWALETAYGVSRGRGRVGSSYMALSGADAVAATRLGYRLEPDAPHAEDVSVDVWAEPALQPPTNPRNTNNHRLGMDLNWKW